jgi:hypothetical protein
MNLNFSTSFAKDKGTIAGKETHFIEKITRSFVMNNLCDLKELSVLTLQLEQKGIFNFPYYTHKNNNICKIHTFRSDLRWKKGMDIHFVIKGRTKDRTQFLPVTSCSGTEKIEILYSEDKNHVSIFIEGILYWNGYVNDEQNLKEEEIITLANNDGFENPLDFFQWFNQDWKGIIIHWTPFRYVNANY